MQWRWPVANKKRALLSSVSTVLFALGVVRTFLLAFKQLSPNVWETWMILTRESLLVDIFLTRRLSKSLTFCEFASVNLKPWIIMGPWCQVAVFFPQTWAYSRFSTCFWWCVTRKPKQWFWLTPFKKSTCSTHWGLCYFLDRNGLSFEVFMILDTICINLKLCKRNEIV